MPSNDDSPVISGAETFITMRQCFSNFSIEAECPFADSAMVRPFRVLIDHGRKVGTINNLFYQDKNSLSAFIVGSVCYTPAKRTLFFPGIKARTFLWHSRAAQVPSKGSVDHFTVESDLKTWHYTVLHNGMKEDVWLPNNNLTEVEPGLYSWFGMSIKDTGVLEPLYGEYRSKFDVPKGKELYYGDILEKAKKESVLQMSLQDEDEATDREFIHFDFLIDTRPDDQAQDIPLNVSLMPKGPPVLTSNIESSTEQFRMRMHQIKIPEFKGSIIMLVSKHTGKLTQDVILTGL